MYASERPDIWVKNWTFFFFFYNRAIPRSPLALWFLVHSCTTYLWLQDQAVLLSKCILRKLLGCTVILVIISYQEQYVLALLFKTHSPCYFGEYQIGISKCLLWATFTGLLRQYHKETNLKHYEAEYSLVWVMHPHIGLLCSSSVWDHMCHASLLCGKAERYSNSGWLTAMLTVETIQLTSDRRGLMLVCLSLVKLHQLRLTYLCFATVQVSYKSDKQISLMIIITINIHLWNK